MSNVVILRGLLSRPVAERVLPSGDRLSVIDLTVPAEPPGKADSVPLAWFDAPTWVSSLEVGSELVVVGKVRRRFFRTARGLESRTEVIVEGAAPARRRARVAELARRVRATVDSIPG